MLIGPALPGGLRLELTSELVSRPYVDMTAAVMAAFGVGNVEVGETHVRVAAGDYVPAQLLVEPDASSASYPLAVAAVRGGRVEVAGLGARSMQGDARFADLMGEMGCRVERRDDATAVSRVDTAPLRGIDVDMSDISDLVPTVAAVALFADTPTRITGVGFIRGKESDRLGDLAHELGALGGRIDVTEDGLVVHPSHDRLHAATLATHHDHRLAMAFGVVSTVVDGIEVTDPEVVTKSWPAYWQMLDGFGMTRTVVAAFDFDGTLTRDDSVVPFLRLVGGRRRLVLGLARRAPSVALAAVRRDRDRLKALATDAVFRGVPRSESTPSPSNTAARSPHAASRDDVVARLGWHLQQGHRVVIVSASYEPYVRVVAEALGVADVVATRLAVDAAEACTGAIDGPNCRAEEKVRRLEQWLTAQGADACRRRAVGVRRFGRRSPAAGVGGPSRLGPRRPR